MLTFVFCSILHFFSHISSVDFLMLITVEAVTGYTVANCEKENGKSFNAFEHTLEGNVVVVQGT